MSFIIQRLLKDPVRSVAAVQATLAAAVLFGLPMSEVQLAAVVIAVAAWLALLTRAPVTKESP